MSLVLKLRPGEVIIINGAPLRFRTRACIELTAQARFMFGKQVISPDQANSPARRIYFALQSAYIGEETEREAGLESARHFIEEFQRATTSEVARQLLTRALVAAESDELPEALKLARRVMQHEDAVIGNPPPEPQRLDASVVPSLPDEIGTKIVAGVTRRSVQNCTLSRIDPMLGDNRPVGPRRPARMGAHRSNRRLCLGRSEPRRAVSAATRGSFYVPALGGLACSFEQIGR